MRTAVLRPLIFFRGLLAPFWGKFRNPFTPCRFAMGVVFLLFSSVGFLSGSSFDVLLLLLLLPLLFLLSVLHFECLFPCVSFLDVLSLVTVGVELIAN